MLTSQCPPQHCFSDIFISSKPGTGWTQCTIIESSDFWLTCRFRGNIHIPFQEVGSCGNGRSHISSPGMPIMRASTLCNPSLSTASKSSWASKAHAFHQPVCQRLSWLHHWSVPYVHQWCLLSFRMRSRSSMPSRASSSLDLVVTMSCGLTLIDMSHHCPICDFVADTGGLALSEPHRHGALPTTHKSCTRSLMSWKIGGGKR